ncbi:unnamed protein product [Spirodela intermedia]|uniref:Uncharacterized protein n=2 Tax=Spirodela intermedia TaxID=51605 RepID=A0A7I8KFF8_SPIIN|nr:unnamed protein product [Spirodela intermedia]CAA6660197.1 unnamed protein product [Spirodela intermedia]CAA7396519.1 unnamed protein product [Spirodela intermedia]
MDYLMAQPRPSLLSPTVFGSLSRASPS